MSILIDDVESDMQSRRTWLTGEPSLLEMMSDELVQALMRRDGVRREELLALLRRTQRILHRGQEPAEAERESA